MSIYKVKIQPEDLEVLNKELRATSLIKQKGYTILSQVIADTVNMQNKLVILCWADSYYATVIDKGGLKYKIFKKYLASYGYECMEYKELKKRQQIIENTTKGKNAKRNS